MLRNLIYKFKKFLEQYYLNNKIVAFTLIELAAGLTIIGIVSSIVFSGVKLYNNSRINSIIIDVKLIDDAVNNFYTKYNYFPGDVPSSTILPGIGSATGNGNGTIENAQEAVYFWYHLSKAGLIKGNYSPNISFQYIIANGRQLGAAYPSQYSGAGYRLVPKNDGSIVLGFATFNGSNFDLPIFTPYEALEIDKKFDDGVPTSGKFISLDASNIGSDTCINSGAYNLSVKNKVCKFEIILSPGVASGTVNSCSTSQIGTVRTSSTACPTGTYGIQIERCISNPSTGSSSWQRDITTCKPLKCQGGLYPNELVAMPCGGGSGWVYDNSDSECDTYFSNQSLPTAPATIYQCKNGILSPFLNCCKPASTSCLISDALRSTSPNPGFAYEDSSPLDTSSRHNIDRCVSGNWVSQGTPSLASIKCTKFSTKYNLGDVYSGFSSQKYCNPRASPSLTGSSSTVYYQGTGDEVCMIDGQFNLYNYKCTLYPAVMGSCTPGTTRTAPCPVGQKGLMRLKCDISNLWEYDFDFMGSNDSVTGCEPVTCDGEPLGSFRITQRQRCPTGTEGTVIELCKLNWPDYYSASWQISTNLCLTTRCFQKDNNIVGGNWTQFSKFKGDTPYTTNPTSSYSPAFRSINRFSAVSSKFDAVTYRSGTSFFSGTSSRYCMNNGEFAPPDIPFVMRCTSGFLPSTQIYYDMTLAHDQLNYNYSIVLHSPTDTTEEYFISNNHSGCNPGGTNAADWPDNNYLFLPCGKTGVWDNSFRYYGNSMTNYNVTQPPSLPDCIP